MSSMAEELEKKNAELEEMKRVSIIVLDWIVDFYRISLWQRDFCVFRLLSALNTLLMERGRGFLLCVLWWCVCFCVVVYVCMIGCVFVYGGVCVMGGVFVCDEEGDCVWWCVFVYDGMFVYDGVFVQGSHSVCVYGGVCVWWGGGVLYGGVCLCMVVCLCMMCMCVCVRQCFLSVWWCVCVWWGVFVYDDDDVCVCVWESLMPLLAIVTLLHWPCFSTWPSWCTRTSLPSCPALTTPAVLLSSHPGLSL
jgi:hypothetical protein